MSPRPASGTTSAPTPKREQQDRAIERYQLVDAGLEWSVASSGWTSAWRTATWETMVSTAQGSGFDVPVVGYVSRFLRNLKQTLDTYPEALEETSDALLKRRSGKATFRFPSLPDEMAQDLEALLARLYER